MIVFNSKSYYPYFYSADKRKTLAEVRGEGLGKFLICFLNFGTFVIAEWVGAKGVNGKDLREG